MGIPDPPTSVPSNLVACVGSSISAHTGCLVTLPEMHSPTLASLKNFLDDHSPKNMSPHTPDHLKDEFEDYDESIWYMESKNRRGKHPRKRVFS